MSAGLIRDANERDARTIADLWTEAYVNEGEGGRTVYRRVPERDQTDESGHERLVFRLAL